METQQATKFIFHIEAEQHFTASIRILSTFGRRRIPVDEMSIINRKPDDHQRFTIMVTETRENAAKLSRRLEKEIDVIKVDIFEHHNQ